MLAAALLLLLQAPAQDEGPPLFTQDDLLEILREAMPAVERATGRKFRDPVWVRVSTRGEVEKALAGELVPQMKILEPDADPGQARTAAERYADVYGGILIAKYAWKSGTIHLVPETIRSLAKLLEQPALLERSVLRVILTHELVHALDSQDFGLFEGLGTVGTMTDLEIRNALAEGHAQHVARRVCAAAGDLPAFEAYEKAILADPPNLSEAERYLATVMTSSLRLAYLDGRAFFDALEKTGRKTYVEDVFRNPPASKNVILKPERFYGGKDAAGGDFDPAPAFEAFAKEFGPDWARRSQELDHATLRATFGDFLDAKTVEAVLKTVHQGHVLVLSPRNPPADRVIALAILRTTDAEAAKRFLEASVDLAKAKDRKFTEGVFKITKAEYGTLALPPKHPNVLLRKTIEIQGQTVPVASVIGVAGDFEFELVVSNEEIDDARLKLVVERFLEALED